MDTTTPDEGAVTAQPTQTPAAVTTGYNADQVITTDSNGTPDLVPVTSDSTEAPAVEAPSAAEAVSEPTPTVTPETQAADKTDDEIVAWSEKKGLTINPANPNEVKLARMQLEAERKMHESRQVRSEVQPPEVFPVQESQDPAIQQIIQDQNETKLKLYVRDWFEANPDAKEHRTELQNIASQRPWLSNMDDVYAHFLANPSRTAELKKEGGREALTNLAQKQQQVPPAAGATNSGVYDSAQITPQNVYELVDRHDQAWFEKNHDAISRAMSGRTS